MKAGETEHRECQRCFKRYNVTFEPGVNDGRVHKAHVKDIVDAYFCPFCGSPNTDLAE